MIEIIVFPSLHLNKNASLLMIRMMYLQEQFRRQRHYQLKLFNKYEINGKYINNGIENQTINKLSKYYHEIRI